MPITEERRIRDQTSAILADWAAGRSPPFTGDTADGFTEAIGVAHIVADEARLGLHRWVDAARRTGVSWSAVGEALGISKQAAQQRFRSDEDDVVASAGQRVVRLGATAFNEMAILRQEGLLGRELVGTGVLKLVFRQTDRRWEYARSISGREAADGGWLFASSWGPFVYLKRPIAEI